MKLASFLSSVFLVLNTYGSAAAQIETQEYISPLTIEKMDITYNVNTDGTYTMEQNARIRINLDLAVQSSAQTYLPFSESLQTLEVLEAYTETAAGEKIEVPEDKIITRESPISAKAPHFSDYKVTAIVFPQISVGAAKTIHYKMTQTKPHFENHFSLFETFPLAIDIQYATLTLIAPEDLKLNIQAVDIEGGKVEAGTPDQTRWTWSIKDQKGQMPEQIAIDTQNFSPRIVASTFADHNEVSEAYLKGAADKEKVTDKVRKLADKITKNQIIKLDQVRALYNWVNGNIRYVSLAFGLGGVIPRDADSIIETGYGDCKDKVVLLNSLLSAKGIASAPALINSGELYWHPDVPLALGIYNHVITYLPEFDMFLDPTMEFAPLGETVTRQMDKHTLVTRGFKNGSGIMKTAEPPPEASNIENITVMTIDEEGTMKCKTTTRSRGTLGIFLRNLMNTIPPGQEKTVARQILAGAGHEGEGNIASSNPRDLDKELQIDSEFTIRNAILLPGPGAFLIPELHLRPIKVIVPMTRLPERKFPMVYSRYTKTETTRITFPKGVEITQIPKDVYVSNKYGSYTAKYTQDGQTVSVERYIYSQTPKGLCTPDIYPTVKEIGEAVMRDMRSQILYQSQKSI